MTVSLLASADDARTPSAAEAAAALDARVRARDPAAFAAAFNRYYPRLLRFVRRLYVADAATADEIVQNVFVRVWREPGALPPSVSVEACLVTVAKSEALQHLRRERRREQREHARIGGDALLLVPATGDPADVVLHRRLLVDKIMEAVRTLPARCRQVFLMKYVDGKSDREIAKSVAVSTGAVQQQLFRARRQVRKLVNTESEP